MSIAQRLATAAFARVFRASGETVNRARPQLNAAVSAIAKIGPKKIKEFLLSLPIFLAFVRELLRERGQLEAQKQLFIIGAAASLSTLGLVILGGVLSSLPMQLLLLFTHPWLGIPLLFSSGLVISAVMIVIVWLIVYVLNLVLSNDPAYQRVRDRFLPPSAQAVLAEVQAEIEASGASIDALRKVVEERLIVRGSKADSKKLERQLIRLEKRLGSASSARLSKTLQQSEGTNAAPKA